MQHFFLLFTSKIGTFSFIFDTGIKQLNAMTKEEKLYAAIGQKLKGSEESQLFGKPCFKINGKAFVCLFENEMVFKLTGDEHQDAIDLSGSQLFDPSKKKRPMKEWVQVPGKHSAKWKKFAEAAMEYVKKGK